jgi:hypothetical protein
LEKSMIICKLRAATRCKAPKATGFEKHNIVNTEPKNHTIR